jgi:hypothetical protein
LAILNVLCGFLLLLFLTLEFELKDLHLLDRYTSAMPPVLCDFFYERKDQLQLGTKKSKQKMFLNAFLFLFVTVITFVCHNTFITLKMCHRKAPTFGTVATKITKNFYIARIVIIF